MRYHADLGCINNVHAYLTGWVPNSIMVYKDLYI